MSRDDLYEQKSRQDVILDRAQLTRIVEKARRPEFSMDDLTEEERIAWRQHTIELSYRLREQAIQKYPDSGLGQHEFDEYYTKLFRDLDAIELESMILSHENVLHFRRENTIKIIRDAYMNKLLMEDDDE